VVDDQRDRVKSGYVEIDLAVFPVIEEKLRWKHANESISERQRELRRRRVRKKKMTLIKAKAAKASASEKEVLAAKVRRMTPGAIQQIEALGLK